MSDKLFGDNADKGSQSNGSSDDENVDFVAHYFGDKKPTEDDYKEILKGKYFADKHVKTLEIENKGLRTYEQADAKYQALIDKLNNLEQNSSKRNDDSNRDSQGQAEPKTPRVDENALTPEKVQELIQAHLAKQSETTNRQRNLEIVKQKAIELYGRNYEDVLLKKTNEIGASPSFIESIAVSNPTAFFKMMEMDVVQERPVNTSPPRTNTDAAKSGIGRTAGTKNYAFFRNLQKTDPRAYNSKAVQNEMHKLAAQMGEDFYR